MLKWLSTTTHKTDHDFPNTLKAVRQRGEPTMWRLMCKSKIHRAIVTETNLHYEGSLTLDVALMEAAGLLPFEQVHVLNLNNGERFETYLIEGERGSGVVGVNGAAARLVQVGDPIIVLAYAWVAEEQLPDFRARIVFVDEGNRILRVQVVSVLPSR